MKTIFIKSQQALNSFRFLDFLAPLALRLYLAPIFITAGLNKLQAFNDTVEWFGNAEWGLGLPLPWLMTVLAITAELVGGFALILGFATRWFAGALMATMLIAIFWVHWPNGWFAIAPSNPQTSTAAVLEKVSFPGASSSLENSAEVGLRLSRAKELLREHGHYDWLTEKGTLVVLNNGIEFAVTYLIMLFSLFFSGAGRIISIDYWLARAYIRNPS